MVLGDFRLARWTSTFVSKETEGAFQRHIYRGNLKTNVIAICLALLVHGLYGALDFNTWGADAATAIKARLISVMIGAALLATLLASKIRMRHELVCAAITVVMGLSVLSIVHHTPGLNHAYYVAFIQGGVFVCCLLRIGFVKPVIVMATFISGFVWVAFQKDDLDEAILQTFILVSMSVILAFAAYLLQRYRRQDFVKSQIIEMQNQQLTEMLAETRRDNERKVAALNMLLHIVRTPVHQISGFADLVVNQLKAAENELPVGDCLESAGYIKAASDSLRSGVSKLLQYHQLDEASRRPEIEALPVLDLLHDAAAQLPEETRVAITASVKTFAADRRIVEAVVHNIVQNLTWVEAERPTLDIDVSEVGERIVFTFRDNGAGIPQEIFARATRPLTEIDNYLSGDGSSPTMGLRIAARAIEIAGAALDYRWENGAVITISFPKLEEAAGEAQARCAA